VAFTRTISNVLARRSTVLSIVAVAAALCWSSSEANAGVILPWVQDSSATAVDYTFDGAGSSSAPSEPAPGPTVNEKESRKVAGMRALDGLVETGGASAPPTGTAGQMTSAAVAILQVPMALPVTRSFGYLRETTPQLPQPPLGELLDPPKACA
jgi:hypothetical protein